MELTTRQRLTLTTLTNAGGEMNAYAGQKGLLVPSLPALVAAGRVERVADCDGCVAEGSCLRPLAGQKGGQRCYNRVRVAGATR